MKCDICGKEDIKNLGVHKFHVHRNKPKPGEVIEVDHSSQLQTKVSGLVVDNITEKPLSVLISEIKNLLRIFRNEIDVRISEKGGRINEVEIRARIQL